MEFKAFCPICGNRMVPVAYEGSENVYHRCGQCDRTESFGFTLDNFNIGFIGEDCKMVEIIGKVE